MPLIAGESKPARSRTRTSIAVLDMLDRNPGKKMSALKTALPERNFDFLLTQRGMFSYTGFSADQVDVLREEHGIYLIASGRVCVAGLNHGNIARVASAFAAVCAR